MSYVYWAITGQYSIINHPITGFVNTSRFTTLIFSSSKFCTVWYTYAVAVYVCTYVALSIFMSIKQLCMIIMQDLPPVQPIDFVLSEDSTLEQIGSVHSIVEQIGRCVYAYTV